MGRVSGFEIVFADTSIEIYRALEARVPSCSEDWMVGGRVSTFHASVFDFPGEGAALVSPANSFGFMDGGIDALYLEVLGEDLEDRVRDHLAADYHGELLVGQATIVDTEHPESFPLLIVAPTMRVPTILPADTINPYLAIRAALRAAAADPRVRRVIIPGMGTGVGLVDPDRFAIQAHTAIREFFAGQENPDGWWEAAVAHQALLGQSPRDLQFAAGAEAGGELWDEAF
jgi:O-acetyl-ADP-ribose deacetylase (regulator of RNase III)